MQKISFIEKKPWHDDSPFTGGCDMFPVYMVTDVYLMILGKLLKWKK